MPDFKKIFVLFLLFISFDLFGQTFADKYFNPGQYLNPYYISGNPAFLHMDNNDELLSISSGLNNTEGSFKKFLDPELNRKYSLSFEGKKTLDSIQIFKGSFSLSKEEYKKWQWNFTKYYNSGTPFLIGDSTTGNSRFNGININAAYNRLLAKGLYAGAGINYYVDEGLKTISPRPVSIHREIDITAGLGYYITPDFVTSLSFQFFDEFEKISYMADEGALFQETKIYKYSGLDLPQVLSKKSETRFYYYNGYKGKLSFEYNLNESIKIIPEAEIANLRSSVNDGASRPYDVGYYNVDSYSGGLTALLFLNNSTVFIGYNYDNSNGWARHPKYTILMMEEETGRHNFSMGGNYIIGSRLSLAGKMSFESGSLDCNDYYSSIKWDGKYNRFDISAGFNLALSSIANLKMIYGFASKTMSDFNNEDNGSEFFSANPRRADVLYSLTDYINHFIGSEINLNLTNIGKINLVANYNKIVPGNTFIEFEDQFLNKLDLLIEYRVDVY